MGRRKDDASGGARSVDVDAHASGGPSAAVDRRTLFVRGVAFGATNEELEAAFAAVGPVRSAFLVGGAVLGGGAAVAASPSRSRRHQSYGRLDDKEEDCDGQQQPIGAVAVAPKSRLGGGGVLELSAV